MTCCGDSCHFPISGEGWDPTQLGSPSLLTSGSSSMRGCLGNGVIWIGKTCGWHDDDATGGSTGGRCDNKMTGGVI